MRLATLRRGNDTVAVRVDSDTTATVIDGYADLSALLAESDWQSLAQKASGESVDLADADFAPVVPSPGKIVCVGLNYATHIQEMGRELPTYPTLFSKFKEALTGPYDDVIVPSYAASEIDWEAELAVVIGKQAYQVSEADAAAYIAGYSVINDYTMRDYQYRTLQWDQGKTFEKTSGFGPFLDTEYVLGSKIETRLEGEVMQSATTDDLVFTPAKLVEYISHIVTLQPGDVIITGTTGGVGHARKPARYVQDGETVEVSIEGLGSVKNKTIVK
ncbi:fumarylacetoacetate hydrolase family protein [Rhodococcus qingshengii]|uniref:fumarylacetoacetate hydrolase family protein n=1 Tax=Rhodococcus qingshengii TaxID=334542 RepID=UPI0022B5189A|nr:fumarylacetoacetate hydrolase family protein [Rhodococcus qingshengii]MCZ4618615.1 fumarylacetoacetate hydrolase family protein [Rhodococcus qingshengii]